MNNDDLLEFDPKLRCHRCEAPILWDTVMHCTVYHCMHFGLNNPYSRIAFGKAASSITVPKAFYDAFKDDEDWL
jgi:hypothetical protein